MASQNEILKGFFSQLKGMKEIRGKDKRDEKLNELTNIDNTSIKTR